MTCTYGTRLTHRQGYVRPRIELAQFAFHVVVCLFHRHAGQIQRAHPLDGHRPVGGNRPFERGLRSPPDVNNHIVARAKPVIGWGRDVQTRFKRQQLIIKYVAAEDLVLILFKIITVINERVYVHETDFIIKLLPAHCFVFAF